MFFLSWNLNFPSLKFLSSNSTELHSNVLYWYGTCVCGFICNTCRSWKWIELTVHKQFNKLSSSLAASFWGTYLVGSAFIHLQWIELADIYLLIIVSHRSGASESIIIYLTRKLVLCIYTHLQSCKNAVRKILLVKYWHWNKNYEQGARADKPFFWC